MGLLEKVISKDQELSGTGRWLKGTENSSLVVDTDKQIFFWNSRGIVGDVYVWLTQVKGMSYGDAKEYLKGLDTFTGAFIHDIRDKEEQVVYPKLVDVFYENGLDHTEYWDRRGINADTIHRFKLGYNNGWFTVPIYQDGLFKNFQLRQDKPEKKILHYYKNTGPFMFNSDILKLTDSIVITEGLTDCLRLYQEGIPCVSHTNGAEVWLDDWYKYFFHQKIVYVIYDNDNAGKLGAIKVAKNLGIYRTYIYNFEGHDEKYDIVEFFREGNRTEDMENLLKNKARRIYE
jgi:DNA primase